MSARNLMLAVAAVLALIAAAGDKSRVYEMYKGNPRPYWGVRLSGGYSYPYRVEYGRTALSSKATGFDVSATGLFHAPIRNRWYAEPTAEIYFNSLKTAGTMSQVSTDAGVSSATLKTIGFRIPMIFGWHSGYGYTADKRLYIFGGPEFDFRLKTWFSTDVPTTIFDSSLKRPLYGDYGVDLNLRGGIGYSFGRYYIGASYSWKLCRIAKSDYGAKRTRLLQLSLGYNFKPL